MNISQTEKKKFADLEKRTEGAKNPIVLINACTHGHETVGLDVIDRLKDISLDRGNVLFSVANERAREAKKAFLETDLNRVFPGDREGTYEEQLAAAFTPAIRASDVVVDIHSTKTLKCPSERMLIVTKWDKETQHLVEAIGAPRVLIMELNSTNALVSQARIGIAFEYGPNDAETADAIAHAIRDILRALSMISREDVSKRTMQTSPSSVYHVYDTFPKKPGDVLSPGTANFQPVQVGDVVAHTASGVPIRADRDFIPILFGENRYTDIFGFVGEE